MKADVSDNMAAYQDDKIWVRMLPQVQRGLVRLSRQEGRRRANKEVSGRLSSTSWKPLDPAYLGRDVVDHAGDFRQPHRFFGRGRRRKMMARDGRERQRLGASAFLTTGAFWTSRMVATSCASLKVWPKWKNLTCDLTYTLNTACITTRRTWSRGTPMVLEAR